MKVSSVEITSSPGGMIVDEAGQVWTMAPEFAAELRKQCEAAINAGTNAMVWPVRAIGQVEFPLKIT